MNNTNNHLVAKRIIAAAIALIAWQLLSVMVHQNILLVGPWQVLVRLVSLIQEAEFWKAIGYSFSRITIGFFLGTAFGMLFAALAYKFHFVEILLWPWMATIKAVPVASFIVICLIWLSLGRLAIFISFLIVLPITYQNILSSLKEIDESIIDLGQLEAMGYFGRLKNILIPQIAPQLISTVSITAGMAWKAGVAAEIIGTPNGSIGKALYLSKIYLATDELLAWTVTIVLISIGFEKLIVHLLKKIFE